MSGYVALTNFRYMNLCVDAEPAALLCINVEVDGVQYNIEDVADVSNPQKDQFALFPKENNADLNFAICKGIKSSHPEFDVDVKEIAREDSENDEKETYILLTMPKVDKNRHDVLTQGVDGLNKECSAKLDFILQEYTKRVTIKLIGCKEDEISEAKDGLKEIYDKHKEMIDSYTEAKMKQIDDAYERYQQKQAEGEKEKNEEEAAHNEAAGRTMSIDDEDIF